MLNVRFGTKKHAVENIWEFGRPLFRNEWAKHPFIVEMAEAINKAAPLPDWCYIKPQKWDDYSGSFMTFMCMFFHPEHEYDVYFSPTPTEIEWMLKIGGLKDVYIAIDYLFSIDRPFTLRCITNGEIVTDSERLCDLSFICGNEEKGKAWQC